MSDIRWNDGNLELREFNIGPSLENVLFKFHTSLLGSEFSSTRDFRVPWIHRNKGIIKLFASILRFCLTWIFFSSFTPKNVRCLGHRLIINYFLLLMASMISRCSPISFCRRGKKTDPSRMEPFLSGFWIKQKLILHSLNFFLLWNWIKSVMYTKYIIVGGKLRRSRLLGH